MKLRVVILSALFLCASLNAFCTQPITNYNNDQVSNFELTLKNSHKGLLFKAKNWIKKSVLKGKSLKMFINRMFDFDRPNTVLTWAIGFLCVGLITVLLGSFLWMPIINLGYLVWFGGLLSLLYWTYIKYLA